MSIPEQIRALEELASVDAELKSLDDQLTEERSALSLLKGNLKTLEEKLQASNTQISATDRARTDAIADVRTMMQQLEHSREKLNRSRTERETNAATRELEELRKLVRDREDEIEKLNNEGAGQRAQIDATEADIGKLKGELGSSEGDVHSKLADLEKQKAERKTAREIVVKKLPPVLFRKYDFIRAKKGVGIAQTTDGTCKACNMALPPQLFHRLRREPLIEQCQSCQRLIYFVPPQVEAEQET